MVSFCFKIKPTVPVLYERSTSFSVFELANFVLNSLVFLKTEASVVLVINAKHEGWKQAERRSLLLLCMRFPPIHAVKYSLEIINYVTVVNEEHSVEKN